MDRVYDLFVDNRATQEGPALTGVPAQSTPFNASGSSGKGKGNYLDVNGASVVSVGLTQAAAAAPEHLYIHAIRASKCYALSLLAR